ncbi:PREDICTED: uncharacterized protein LOC108751303, partial [Trachymyrmex septentrionalis]|uniref:uncharacterized protein LOC108751303 n=1 Tax=Trachymyrmex septentrionalis TaxID=34720 RepID=UPI00084F1122
MQQEMNKKKQKIDQDLVMEEYLNTIEMGAVSEELNTLLQRYTMIYRIRNHWEIHHGPKNKIYNEVKNDKTIQTILKKYKITDGNLATCPDCQYSKNLEEDTQLSVDTLDDMNKHWKLHNVDDNDTKRKRNIQNRLQNLREKRREAATQISHQAE